MGIRRVVRLGIEGGAAVNPVLAMAQLCEVHPLGARRRPLRAALPCDPAAVCAVAPGHDHRLAAGSCGYASHRIRTQAADTPKVDDLPVDRVGGLVERPRDSRVRRVELERARPGAQRVRPRRRKEKGRLGQASRREAGEAARRRFAGTRQRAERPAAIAARAGRVMDRVPVEGYQPGWTRRLRAQPLRKTGIEWYRCRPAGDPPPGAGWRQERIPPPAIGRRLRRAPASSRGPNECTEIDRALLDVDGVPQCLQA